MASSSRMESDGDDDAEAEEEEVSPPLLQNFQFSFIIVIFNS